MAPATVPTLRGELRPDDATIAASRLSAFVRFCEERTERRFADHRAFHDFSVAERDTFWLLFLEWADLLWDGSPRPACTDASCERAEFFPDLRLSYVENLLRARSPEEDGELALIARHADRPTERFTRAELRERVLGAAAALRERGLRQGDRVAAVVPNDAQAVIAGLAAAALGATFSSAAPDMGTPAVLSRFEQLLPAVLLAPAARAAELAGGLPTVRAVVPIDEEPLAGDAAAVDLERFAFNQPLFVVFTSGTTGPPKCLVHGAGGTLIEHVKEHRLHVDLRRTDRLFFHTSAAWMMWNWQLSALASGAAIVVYDGPLGGPETLWRIAAEEEVTVLGTSPPYLQLCEDRGHSPAGAFDLKSLRAVLSTGSVLHDWQYDWVRDHVGNVPLQSISGGTDIVGCFVLGNPNLPVRRGWIQGRSLGLDVQSVAAADWEAGIGELVCRNPFPSRPLGLLGDDDGARFRAAYFEQNPPAWTHGDLIEFDDRGQARIHGRSDGVINVDGVRIGPAEIYRALRGVPEASDAAAVEQRMADARSRLVLLVVLRDDATLDAELVRRIRREIAAYATPAHVPALVVAVPELPYTHSGKRSERAARDALSGGAGDDGHALRNPGSLEAIRRAVGDAREPVAAPAGGEESLESAMVAIWEQVLGVALGPDDDFFALGGTSLNAFELLELVRDRTGVELPPSTLIHARTPAALAAVVHGPDARAIPTLVELRPGTGRPLFLVHSIWGDVFPLRPLALALRTARPVFGLQARGLDAREQPQERVETMAATYLDAVRSVQPSGPYAIAGYSFGGLVAFEMARSLAAAGEAIEWLGLLDSNVHHSSLPPVRRASFVAARPLRTLRIRLGVRTRVARYRAERMAPWAPLRSPAPEASPLLLRVRRACWAAFDAYRPEPYDGPATFVAATGAPSADPVCRPLPAWRRLVRGGLTLERVPGDHDDFIRTAAAAEAIDARLRAPAPS